MKFFDQKNVCCGLKNVWLPVPDPIRSFWYNNKELVLACQTNGSARRKVDNWFVALSGIEFVGEKLTAVLLRPCVHCLWLYCFRIHITLSNRTKSQSHHHAGFDLRLL